MNIHDATLQKELIRRIRRLSSRRRVLPTGMKPRLTPLHGIRAVLFDLYGTLLISGAGDPGSVKSRNQAGVLQAAMTASGIRVLSPLAGQKGMAIFQECIRKSHEAGCRRGNQFPEINIITIWRRTLSRLVKSGQIEAEIDQTMVKILAVEYECRNNPVCPMPGMARMLRQLVQKNLSLGVVSNAQFFTPLLFEAFFPGGLPGLGIHERLSTWSWKHGIAKPSPDFFQLAIDRIQREHSCRTKDILMVGNDMLNDVSVASRLGCSTVLFAGDARSLRMRENDRECRKTEPDAIITHLDQLDRIIHTP
jgi:putative hydrolase of the HAD superfamily